MHHHHHRHSNPLKKYLGIFILFVIIAGVVVLLWDKTKGDHPEQIVGTGINTEHKPATLSIEPTEFFLPQEGGDITIYVSTDADDWYADCTIRGAKLVKDEDRLHVHIPFRRGNAQIGSVGIKVDYDNVCLHYREAVIYQEGSPFSSKRDTLKSLK